MCILSALIDSPVSIFFFRCLSPARCCIYGGRPTGLLASSVRLPVTFVSIIPFKSLMSLAVSCLSARLRKLLGLFHASCFRFYTCE